MSIKAVVFICALALLAHAISAQFFGSALSRALAGGSNPAGNGISLANSDIGLANSGINMGNSDIGLANSGINMGNSDIGLGYSGIGLGNGGINLGNSDIGLGYTGVGLTGSTLSLGAPMTSAGGGSFTVTSSSPIAPKGVSVVTEYVIESPTNVGGKVLSTPSVVCGVY